MPQRDEEILKSIVIEEMENFLINSRNSLSPICKNE